MAGSNRYPFTKFAILTDTESVASARKKYFIWITIITVLFCVVVAYFSIKLFIAPKYFNYHSPLSSKSDSPSIQKLFNPKSLLAEFQRTPDWDISREGSQSRLEPIPVVLIQEMLEKNVDNIHDFIQLDLLLHYRNLIFQNTKADLKKIFNEYQSKLSLVRNSQDFVHFLNSLKSNRFKFYVQNLKENLKIENFQSVFALTEELNHWYNYLSRLNVFLSGYEHQKLKNYSVNCTKSNFNSFTESTQKFLFRFAYPFNITEKKLQEINEVIYDWAKPFKTELGNSSVTFFRKVLLLSDVNRLLRELNTSMKSLYLFASDTIYLDDDVHLPGVNLAMIAPNWAYMKTVKINLNGPEGRNMTDNAGLKQPGKPGTPGGNAGDFLGVGRPHEKYLLVTANGGRGGNGQNGTKGQDGINNTRPDPPIDKPTCATKVNTFKNAFGQSITHYKVYSWSGCGASGTDGGVGGRGGAGGSIILISEKSVKIQTGLTGPTGSPGKGGAGGAGGHDGCFYDVFDVDDETLHRITRVKCLYGNTLPSGDFGRDDHNSRGQIFPPVKEHLKIHKCLIRFLELSSDDFNPKILPVLKQLIQISKFNPEYLDDIINEYKLLEIFDKPEFYDLFYEQINLYIQQQTAPPVLSHLKSLTLARMTLLKPNVHFHFIDFKNFLNLLVKSVKNTNEHTTVFEPSLYLKRKFEIKRKEIQQNLKRMRLLSHRIHPKGIENLGELVEVIWQALKNESSDMEQLILSDLFRSRLMDSSKNYTKGSLGSGKKNFFSISKNKQDLRGHLVNVKNALCAAEDSALLSGGEKGFLRGLIDQLERFLALFYFTEREEMEKLFLQSLHELKEGEGLEVWKIHLINSMIVLQYNSAMDAARLNFHPYKKFDLSKNKTILDDVLRQIILLEENGDQRAVFYKHQMKAVFDKNSALGDFYFWTNEDIKKELKLLFSGGEIYLKSNLINRHVFDKNFLQFTTIKLEFECNQDENDCQNLLMRILTGFKIEITHSGFSYYNWKGETQIVVSEKVSLVYSFRTQDNKQPEIYNSLYKKCQDEEIKLSPFTTWNVRLLPIDEDSDFEELLPFADKVNLRLTGSGTYTS